MADPGVNIPIRATLSGSGLRDAAAGNDALQKELRESQQAMTGLNSEAAKTDAALKDHATAAKQTAAQIDQAGEAHDKAAKKGANFGNAMLQGSRGIQDLSAAGIPGVVNNLEGLASALGMTAGAAGGITLVAVGLDLLVRNWDKIKAAFGAPEEVKAFWSAITPDEATQRRLDAFNRSLEAQIMLNERLAESRKASIQAAREEDELMQKRAALWKGITPTPEERGDLPPLPGTEGPSPAMREAQRKLQEAQASTQQKVSDFKALDQATKEQEQRVANMARIASFDESSRLANASDRAEIDRLSAFENEGGVVPEDVAQRLATLRRQVEERQAQMRAEIQAVPGLTDGLTGDSEKDSEKLQSRAAEARAQLDQLNAQRLQAVREAEQAARAQAKAEEGVAGQQTLDQETRAAQTFKNLGLPPAPGQFGGSDEQGGINAALQRVEQQRAQSTAAAQQLTGVVENLASDSSAAQQQLAQALAAMMGAFRAMSADAAATRAELETMRANRP